ncbi:MAG: prephenate dehydrogenase/arogenate dehydrogenase family protein [Clostridiales Family XIII bacterium]|nr:prephenate dehydrogenase/arogenate dehydrogenase family protein [Clostridiales Family XIII bacterium]
MAARFDFVMIIGMGLIGGSLAGALRADNPRVRIYALDINDETAARAVSLGLADEAPSREESIRLLGDGDVDLVVLAAPVDAYGAWFDFLDESGFEGVVTDTGSTKEPAIILANEHLRKPERFVPGHPMAGSEQEGLDGARSDLFQNAYWILTPGVKTDIYAFRRLHELLTQLGARVLSIDPEEHDRAVAIISHVPHVAAAALVQLAGKHSGENGELLRLAAGGFKDTTRIAAGSAELWTGILLNNREIVADELSEFADIIRNIHELVKNGDATEVKRFLQSASTIRNSLPAKWVKTETGLIEIRIPMDDRKGIIAEITTAAGHAECNIEAIDIDHQTEDRAILELILTDEGDLEGFIETLKESGFKPRKRLLD